MSAAVAASSSSKPEKKKWPAGVPFIVGNEGAERFSFYGMRAILVVFMTQYLMMSEGDSKGVYHLFIAFCYLFPLLGGFLADRYLGRYNTIFYLSFLYCAGHGALAAFEGTKWGLYLGLFLIALGSGAIKPCISTFVGDQFDKSNKELLPKVYSLFYWMINFGSFFSTLLIPWMREKYGPSWAFGLPGILMAIATFILWLGRKHYVRVPPTGEDPNSFMRVVWSVLKTQPVRLAAAAGGLTAILALILVTIFGILKLPAVAHAFEWIALGGIIVAIVAGVVATVQKQPFLEKARGTFPEHAIEGAGAALRIMKMFVWVSIFWALFDQHGGSWVLQAEGMVRTVWEGEVRDGTLLGMIAHWFGSTAAGPAQSLFPVSEGVWLWKFTLAPDQIPSLNPLMVMGLIPIFTALVYPLFEKYGYALTPLRRMTGGMIVAAASFALIAMIQVWMNAGQAVHVLWQVIPFLVITIAEVMVSITGLEFAYTQAPRTMKSTIMSFWLFTVFLGNVIAGYLEHAQFFGPFGQFVMFGGLMGVVAVIFGWLARSYQGREYVGEDDDKDAAPSGASPEAAGAMPAPAA